MSDRLARSLPVVLLLGLVIVYGHSAWLHPTEQALGAVGSEAPGHLWGLWIVIDSLWQQGPFVRSAAGVGFPGGFTAHLMDPVNLLPFGLGYLLGGGGVSGAVLGWNLLHLVAIALAGWGALRCVDLLVTREHPARPAVGLLLVAVIGGGSFLFAHPLLGRTELLPGVLLPHLLADLLPGVQGGDRRRLLRAGLCLGAIALGGAYLAAFVGLTLLPVGLALLVRAHDKPARLLRLVAVAALGLLLWSPAGLALDAHPPRGQVSIWDPSLVMREPGPLWALSSLVRVGPEEALRTSLDPPAYLGLVAVGLALFGLLRDPRRVGPWVALAAWLTALAMGSTVSTGPGPGALTLLLPVSLLDRLVPALYACLRAASPCSRWGSRPSSWWIRPPGPGPTPCPGPPLAPASPLLWAPCSTACRPGRSSRCPLSCPWGAASCWRPASGSSGGCSTAGRSAPRPRRSPM